MYDRRLIAELLARGVDLHEHLVHRTWPRVCAVEHDELGDLLTREPRDLYEPLVGGSGGVGFLPRASPPCHLNRSDEPADANQAVSDHLRHFTLGDLGIALTFGSIAGHGHGGEAT